MSISSLFPSGLPLVDKKSPNLGPNLSNLLIKTRTGLGDVECPSHLCFHQVYLLLTKNHQMLVQIIESNIMSQCLLGYWSRVLGLDGLISQTNNFRQLERMNI